MAKRPTVTTVDRLREMHSRGVEQVLPNTERKIRLRTVDAVELLRENKMPDILTPLVMSTIYDETTNVRALREFTAQDRGSREAALDMVDALDFVVAKAIADDTKVSELTLPEKKWIFQLALGPAQILANFRQEQESDVEALAEGNEV